MGYKPLTLKIPTGYTDEELRSRIGKMLGIRNFSFEMEHKSLDARKKPDVVWQLRAGVYSGELKGETEPLKPQLEIPFRKRDLTVAVVGSGPAGFFAALVLQKAGFRVLLIERGSDVGTRSKAVARFEHSGIFNATNNYAFGEGGAGTFSDGKLTSRSKHISKEKHFILSKYIEAGAPAEIDYLAHPHLGTDNLRKIVKNLRLHFMELSGVVMFDTLMEDLIIKDSQVTGVVTSKGILDAEAVFIAAGHSAYETYRMLIRRGVPFRTKNFALGSRMEHPQEIINLAQWGDESLPGVKAAEYRLTSPADGNHPVFSFCMCPGGIVVPAAAYSETNIVNGMSYYSRNGKYANAACVAGINPNDFAGREVEPLLALDMLEKLERNFYSSTGSYQAPACSISDFLNQNISKTSLDGSYPMGMVVTPLWELLPHQIVAALKAGLSDFIRKMKGFETGILLGLESKTSSPVQVIREANGKCSGFSNLYIIGEGSGYAGGIISSGADGVKAALNWISEY